MAITTTLTDVDNGLPESFKKKILILDDVALVGRTVATQLKMAGFPNVRFETDSRQAIDVISEFQPDMILLDIFMPHISGLELLQEIRANAEFNHIVVLMLSSAGRDEQYKSLELGALGFIQKPTTAGKLVQTVTSKFAIARRLGIQ